MYSHQKTKLIVPIAQLKSQTQCRLVGLTLEYVKIVLHTKNLPLKFRRPNSEIICLHNSEKNYTVTTTS